MAFILASMIFGGAIVLVTAGLLYGLAVTARSIIIMTIRYKRRRAKLIKRRTAPVAAGAVLS